MSWVKLSDDFFEDPAIEELSPEAKLLFLAGLCYSARRLTDGFLDEKALKKCAEMAGVSPKHSEFLTVLRLWTRRKRGWKIRSYLKYNPPAESVRAKQAKTTERVRRWRERDGNTRSNAVANGGDTPAPVPVPVPVPVPLKVNVPSSNLG